MCIKKHEAKTIISFQAKQYIPSKPTRWGLKVWLRCDSITGFCHQLDIYLGRDQYRGASVGQAVVEKLTEGLKGKNFHVFYDGFFTSVSLAKSLLEKRIFSCGTIIRNRKGFPSDLKSVSRMTQGEYFIRYVLVVYFIFNLVLFQTVK